MRVLIRIILLTISITPFIVNAQWIDTQAETNMGHIRDINFIKGQYVAVGDGFGINSAISKNLKNWNPLFDNAHQTPQNALQKCGNYLISGGVASSSPPTYRTLNGETWEPSAIIETIGGIFTSNYHMAISSIACNKNIIVAVGQIGDFNNSRNNYILRSVDYGKTWMTKPISGPYHLLGSVTFVNGYFYASSGIGHDLNYYRRIYRSKDGLTWKVVLSNIDGGYVSGIAYGNGELIAVGAQPAFILKSSDNGNTWQEVTGNWGFGFEDVVFAENQFIAINNTFSGGNTPIFRSFNGTRWKLENSKTKATLLTVRYIENKFIAIGAPYSYSGGIITSIALEAPDTVNIVPQLVPLLFE